MWNLGQLIRTSQVAWNNEPERTSFTAWLLADNPSDRPSAEEALERFWDLKTKDLQALEELQSKEQQEIVAFNKKRWKGFVELEEKRVKRTQQLEHEQLRRNRRKVQKRQNQKMKKKMKTEVDGVSQSDRFFPRAAAAVYKMRLTTSKCLTRFFDSRPRDPHPLDLFFLILDMFKVEFDFLTTFLSVSARYSSDLLDLQ